ncbi:MAG: aspartyl/glutamyl-tRNA amidotransferase subunit A [Omnitrophica bacterium RIFCSPHIGHO2_02_FULL_51_18]|nr:MAG: aspartyl/glutamyl-tRNA amidotransferase subunit A [Omnitrophica bacterium RIFCSPHIGHO2_02_FULL_51_18]
MNSLADKTASELSELYKKNSCTQKEILDSLTQAIHSKDGKLNAYVKFEQTRPIHRKPPATKARHQNIGGQASADGDLRSPLWGVPIAIKDNICVEGQEASCASKILQNYIAPYNATVIEKLLDAGAVIFGRTNMDEFAFGSSCETSFYGPAKNPWDLARVPGGSSGGSAASVASRTAIAALGSDTGGSIRQPAALCGIVGLKPTYGRVSRYGLIAFASSLDQIGPMTRDVRDSALLLNVIAGYDPKDSTSADVPVPDYTSFLGQSIKGMKIGMPKEYFKEGLSKEVGEAIKSAVKKLEGLGAVVSEVSLPHTEHAVNVYYIVAPSEASSNLARFDGVRFGYRNKSAQTLKEMYEKSRGDGFGAEAKRRIILGTFALSSGYYDAYYLKAMKVRTKIKSDFDEAFKKVDVLLTPTAPSPAFKIGEKTEDPLQMYLSDIYTISANLAGVPAISIPCGFSKNNLPIGLQFLAKPFDEGTLFKVSHAFEQATEFHKQKPEEPSS